MKLAIGLNEDRSALVIADQLGQSVELKCRSVKSAWFAGAKAIVGEQSHCVDVYGSFDVLDATGEIHRLMVDNYRHRLPGEPEPDPNESLRHRPWFSIRTLFREIELRVHKRQIGDGPVDWSEEARIQYENRLRGRFEDVQNVANAERCAKDACQVPSIILDSARKS